MGDPKSQRRTYSKPTHPWQGDRIEREDEYVRKYGLKNKREFWKAESFLRDQRAQARSYLPLVLRDDPQGIKEADQLLGKLDRLGVLGSDANLDDVLALDVDAILSRRLQTLTYLKGLAHTPRQARQFIVHGHIAIGDRRVTVPGHLVEQAEEQGIQYAPGSPLNNPAHPLRGGEPGDIPGGPNGGPSEDIEGPGAGPEDIDDEPDADEEEPEAEEAEEEEPEAEGAEDEEEPEAEEAEEEEPEAEEAEAEEPEPEAQEAEEEEPDADEAEAADAADEDADEAADDETKEGEE